MEFEDITYFLDNNQSKFSVICVRFMYEYLALCYIFFFFNPKPFVFLKDISCFSFKRNWKKPSAKVLYCYQVEQHNMFKLISFNTFMHRSFCGRIYRTIQKRKSVKM